MQDVLVRGKAWPAGEPPDTHGNTQEFGIDPASGGLLCHIVADETRRNQSFVVLPLLPRTGTDESVDLLNPDFVLLHVLIEITDGTAFSIIPSVEAKSAATGAYYPILIGNPITETGMQVLKVGPGLQPRTKRVSQDFVPNVFRIKMEHEDSAEVTYAVTCTLAK